MSIKFLKDYKNYRKGEKTQVDNKLGLDLIKKGVAIAHKAIFTQKEN